MGRYVGIVLILAGLASGNDSSMFRGDASRSGLTSELFPPKPAPSPALSLRWTLPVATGQQISSPIIGAGRVYVASTNGILYCLDPLSGNALWTFETSATVTATPLYHRGRVYLASQDGRLYALHASTGELLFSIFHGTAIKGSPLLARDVPVGMEVLDLLILSLGAPAAELRAYNAITGEFLWSGSPGFRQLSSSTPVFHTGYNRVIVGDSAGFWHCYDASTGTRLWEYRTGSLVAYTSAACEGEYVALPSAGKNERNVHVLKQTISPPYHEFHQSVLAIPPASAAEGLVNKVGASPEGAPDTKKPWTKVVPEVLETLLELTRAEREEYLAHLAGENGGDYQDLGEWLDFHAGDADPDLNKASMQTGVSYINLSWEAVSSSPAFVDGRVIVSHRGLSGFGTDEFYTVAIDVSSDPAETKVAWGSMVQSFSLSDFSLVASPAVSASTWVYTARGTELEVRRFSDGTLSGSIDVGEGILGGPTLANGYVYVTTDRGNLHCYESGNAPPFLSVSLAPSGGENILVTNSPTLSWGSPLDPEGGPVSTELQIGTGFGNADLELVQPAGVQLAPGISSHPLGPLPDNTHLFWRIRVRDENGAESAWSTVRDFWVNKDLLPPSAPATIEAIPKENAVEVNWSASESSDVLHYRLTWRESATPSWENALQVEVNSGLGYTVGGLTNGTGYDFRVVAVDAGENESTPVTTSATPNAPILVDGVPFSGTVQAALDAALPDSTVRLGFGTFVGNLSVPEGVSLEGISARYTRIVGYGTGAVIHLEGTYDPSKPASEISHLSITNGQTGIDGQTADLDVHHVIVYMIQGDAIRSGSGGKLVAINNTLCQNLEWGISTGCDPTLVEIRNNLAGMNGGGFHAMPGSLVAGNSAWENYPEADFATGITAEENISTPTIFVHPPTGDYRVVSGAAIDGADPADPYGQETLPNGGRRNLGAFGNTPWAANSPGIFAAPRDTPGGCGALGVEFLLLLGILRMMRRFTGRGSIPAGAKPGTSRFVRR